MEFIFATFFMAAISMAVAAIFFKKQFVWWEYLVMGFSPFFIAFMVFFIDQEGRKWDTEYFTNTTTRVEYVEYWETYVEKTCYRDCNCRDVKSSDGKSSHRECDRCPYDCSYCDHNPAQYWAYDEKGHGSPISALEYQRIKSKFGNEQFVDLHRHINYSGGCGKDGNKYVSTWNGDLEKYEPYCTDHRYENKVRLSNTYNFSELTDTEKNRIKNYPPIVNVYQPSIVGQWPWKDDLQKATFKLDRFNGLNGKKLQIKAFIFTYYNQQSDVVDLQKRYFEGGNKNEIIVCVGYDKNGVTWVRAFSWTDEKICENEAVRFYTKDMKLETLVDHMIPVWTANWKRKEFTPLNELIHLSPSLAAWITMIVLQIIIVTILTIAFSRNEYQN